MIDKKELISTYLQQFGSHYQISRLLNPTLRIDDEFISHFFEQVVDQYGETFAITEEEKTEIERKIKSQYCIFQDEGAALVGDYEHDFMWYANLQAQEDYDEYYWPRYKAHLENKNFSPAGIDTLENKTLPKLMSYIGNPNEDSPFSIRGLVVGDVQSGKTSNYLGLITKAADAGYKVIFLLTGTIESLRRQTQKRVEEGFIGYDSVNAEDEDRITINDNRISLYSRGKLGEYDILSKIKNNRNSEAYVIGELYVDIFEQDGLADMAISNRRGYEENDPRYIEVIKIAKRLLGYIVGQKDIVSKRRKEDDQRIEDEKIKKKFWENPQTREILELRLNDAEKQVVQEENLQFTRAVNNGKQTKKIFISHKEEHKLYGQFIVDVLETYGVDVVSTIIFTGDRRLGVPQGKDIYDYLKDCFREDLMVIFLFSKAFYDSNICISEAGAAWATNQNCMNVVIDISFSDIEKPSNNALSSIKFQQIRTPDQTITVTEFFKTIIEEGLHFEYDESKLQKALNYVLKTDKYSDQKIDFPATFLPKRKFLPVPRCPKCHNIMLLTEENGRLKYVCSNVSCDECYEAVIN